MDDNDQDLIADIVYNKLYSHKEIEKMAKSLIIYCLIFQN
jgi:hypothetical protein